MGVPLSDNFYHSQNQNTSGSNSLSIFVKGSLEDLALEEAHDYKLATSSPYFESKLKLTGKNKISFGFKGNAEVEFGVFDEAWREVERKAAHAWGVDVELTGLSSKDKIGKYPIAGLLFMSSTPIKIKNTKGALSKIVYTPIGAIVWVYFDMKGKISLDGTLGISQSASFAVGYNKPRDKEYTLINEIGSQDNDRFIKAPFLEGKIETEVTAGIEVDLDLFLSGVRVANANTGLIGNLKLSAQTKNGQEISYGVDQPGDNWEWSLGTYCYDISAGAGFINNINVNFGAKLKTYIKDLEAQMKFSRQDPSQDVIDHASAGWVPGTFWYKATPRTECVNIPKPNDIYEHALNYRVPVDENKLHEVANKYYDFAYLSNRIYNKEKKNSNTERNWILVEDRYDSNGFYGGIYKNSITGEYVVVYGGTGATPLSGSLFNYYDMAKDIVSDLTLLTNSMVSTSQAKSALDFITKDLASYLNSGKIKYITGHSLGGGLAEYIGLYTGIETITFNPAPIPFTKSSYELFKSKGLVTKHSGSYDRYEFKYKDKIVNIMRQGDPISIISTYLMQKDEEELNSGNFGSNDNLFLIKNLMGIDLKQSIDFLNIGEKIYLTNSGTIMSNHFITPITDMFKQEVSVVADIAVDNTTVIEGAWITFDGSGSTTPNNSIIEYLWVEEGELGSICIEQEGSICKTNMLQIGIHKVKLQVKDDAGKRATKVIEITVNPPQQTIPSAPTNVQATYLGGNQVKVTWTDTSDNETNFEVFYPVKTLATVGADVQEAIIAFDNLVDGEDYHMTFNVIAKNSIGDSTVASYTLEFTANIGNVNLQDGLVAHYEFEGNANDSSGNGNDGTEHGGVTYVDGVIGKGAKFTEYLDLIELPNTSLDGKINTTTSVWIKFDNKNVDAGILSTSNSNNDNEYLIFVGSSGNSSKDGLLNSTFNRTDNSFLGEQRIDDEQFHLITTVTTNNSLSYYIDGILDKKFDVSLNTFNIESSIWLGNDQDSINGSWEERQQFHGIMDDLRIYNRALSEGEIKKLYEMGQPNLEKGLVAHYEFEDNANDSSGNGNDGTEHGGVTYVDGVIGKAGSFDGVDDYIDVLHSDSLSLNSFTLSTWVKVDENTNYQAILLKGRYNGESDNNQREYELRTNYGSFYGTKWNSVSLNNPASTAKWELLTLSYDLNYLKIYKNGILESSKVITENINKPSIPESLTLGSAFDVDNGSIGNVQQALKGLLDDLRIYNRALNDSEIQELYKLGQ